MFKFIFLFLFFISAQAEDLFVLIPGAASSGSRIHVPKLRALFLLSGINEYFSGYQRHFKKKGLKYLVCPGKGNGDTRSIKERAEGCALELLQSCSQDQLHLVGHSMGGMIARYLANDPRLKDCVKSVTSISTPHRGTVLANFAIEEYQRRQDDKSWGDLADFFGFTPDKKRYLPDLVQGPVNGPIHLNITQNPEVNYYSISNSRKGRLSFFFLSSTYHIIRRELKKRGWIDPHFQDDNDGIVPESSMVFGKYLGRVEADHLDTTCAGLLRFSTGCENLMELLLPHLLSLKE